MNVKRFLRGAGQLLALWLAHRLTPRTLQQSRFGPYSQLHVEPLKYGIKAWIWAIGVGMAVGCMWWICVALRAGA